MKGLERRIQRIWSEGEAGPQGRDTLASLLTILSWPYRAAVTLRNGLYDGGILKGERLPCRVVSVGNLTVGGTGKTPLVILLAKVLKQEGFRPAVLSRGYGRRAAGRVQVVSDGEEILLSHEEGGDEPVLIAWATEGVPVLVSSRRYQAGKRAIEMFGADVLILDDGFQHRSLFRDVDVVLLDALKPWGNGRLLPRGPLREPARALRRAHIAVLTRTPEKVQGLPAEDELKRRFPDLACFRALHRPRDMVRGGSGESLSLGFLAGKRVFAFCGIARPESFSELLSSQKARSVICKAFPDHHRYQPQDLENILAEAKHGGAEVIVTTGKDGVKLVDFPDFMEKIVLMRIEMDFSPDREAFLRQILALLRA